MITPTRIFMFPLKQQWSHQSFNFITTITSFVILKAAVSEIRQK